MQKPATATGRDAIYYRYWLQMAHHYVPAHYGIRTKDYKLAFFYGLPLDAYGSMPANTPPYWELYDMNSDRAEMHNIYGTGDTAEVTAQLKDQLLALKKELGDNDEIYPELMAYVRSTGISKLYHNFLCKRDAPLVCDILDAYMGFSTARRKWKTRVNSD